MSGLVGMRVTAKIADSRVQGVTRDVEGEVVAVSCDLLAVLIREDDGSIRRVTTSTLQTAPPAWGKVPPPPPPPPPWGLGIPADGKEER